MTAPLDVLERPYSRRRASRHLIGLVCAQLLLGAAAVDAAPCSPARAELTSAQGTVELQRAGNPAWLAATVGDALCAGDSINVGADGRAALRLDDDTDIRLAPNSTLNVPPPQSAHPTWIELVRGLIHVISRDPRELKFTTPYANAGLEGTEFVVEVAHAETSVTVVEGAVRVENATGGIDVAAGERGIASLGAMPTEAPAGPVTETLQWALYYAPVLGDSERSTAAPLAARAAARLAVGQIGDARADLAALRASEPGSAAALALESAMALAHNDKATARRLAAEAVQANPGSAAAWLARSYVEQAELELAEARDSVRQAAQLAPDDALTAARLAELELSLGHTAAGLDAAKRAAALDPKLGYAQTMLGFAALNALDLDAALAQFERAVRLDSAAPLPHLGLGLALVRRGELERGRREFETAVLLDPDSALARSYAAKAYYDERRDKLPGTQLELAKRFDPSDPTAWLYDAIRKQSVNRPAEALGELQQAIALNDNALPFRSTLRLDEDLPSRSASLGRIYSDLGFEQLAIADGLRAVEVDPAEYSGHRLLADVYASQPRHQIARVNELYQAQLLQPFNMTPQPPQLAETNSFILDTAGPDTLAYNEFNPLLARRGVTVQGAGVTGGNDTRGEQVVVAGLGQRLSYSVGQFRFKTDGFRANNDLDNDVRNAFLQFRPNERLSLQAELRSTDTDKGDLQMLFDPENFSPNLRQHESVDALRLGLSREIGEHGVLLTSIIRQQGTLGATVPVLDLDSDFTGTKYELAYLYDGERWDLRGGIRHYTQHDIQVSKASLPVPFPPFTLETTETNDGTSRDESVFGYAQLAVSDKLRTSFGASIDHTEDQGVTRQQANPKLGIVWQPTDKTMVRAALFRTLQGSVISKQNIQPQLEPTGIAGFNQQFFGTTGEDARRLGVGLDHKLGDALFAGLNLSRRDLDVPTLIVQPGAMNPTPINIDVTEDLAGGYVYWAANPRLALSGEYRYERFDNHGQIFAEGFAKLRTHRLPLSLRYFAPSGWSSGITATYVDQRGDFGAPMAGTNAPTEVGADQFWVVDGTLGYRLPQRRGRLSLTVYNLLDRQFRFQDTDPENPTIMPERMVFVRFTLAY